jgi:hypothetical protein
MTRLPPLAVDDHVWRNPATLSAAVDGELVALDVPRGLCFGLDVIGARLWDLVETPTEIAAVCDALAAIYDVDADTCRADVLALLGELEAEGLIQRCGRDGAA